MAKSPHQLRESVFSIKMTQGQRDYLELKSERVSRDLGKNVSMGCLIRSLIQRELETEQLKDKVWEDNL